MIANLWPSFPAVKTPPDSIKQAITKPVIVNASMKYLKCNLTGVIL